MELHGELGRRHLTFWSSAQAISQQMRALQSIVFDAVELTLVASSTALVQACERSILLTGTSSIIEMFSRGSGRATCVSCVEVLCRVGCTLACMSCTVEVPFWPPCFYWFFGSCFGAMMKQACRQTLKSLAAECFVGVRLELLNS